MVLLLPHKTSETEGEIKQKNKAKRKLLKTPVNTEKLGIGKRNQQRGRMEILNQDHRKPAPPSAMAQKISRVLESHLHLIRIQKLTSLDGNLIS